MTKILFLAEAVTWSQVTRLLVLARALDPTHYDVTFASARFDSRFFDGSTFAREPIWSLTPEQMDARVARGGRIYDRATLARYVKEELELFDRVEPDIVVSDLRWSTTISAPLAGVRLATLIDGYWFRSTSDYPIPDHPLVRLFGASLVARGYARALPHVLRHFAAPVNALRTQQGLPVFGDLRDVLAFGDRLLFPDDPSLVASDRDGTFLGPVTWSPDTPMPEWWAHVGEQRPLVYVTLGSSGPISVVPKVLLALASLDVDVVLATAGRLQLRDLPANVRVVDVIAGDVAAKRASVVVCSGGASTGWQALVAGTPVIGIPANLDACLAMKCIEDSGAGIGLRPEARTESIREAISLALHSEHMKGSARRAAESAAKLSPHVRFRETVDSLVAS